MRKLPIGPISYQVWYLYNPDNPKQEWRSLQADDLPNAYRLVEELTRGATASKLNLSMKVYVIEFRGKIIGEQDYRYQ